MKILHFYKTYFPDSVGGVELVINQLARATANFGIKSDVLTLTPKRGERSIEFDGHEVHRSRMHFQIASTGFSASVFSHFIQLAKQADIIHYHYPWPFMDMVHFITQVQKPTVLTYHSDIIRQKLLLKFYSPLQKRFLRSVDKIVATSPNYFQSSQVLAKYKDKTSVIPIGLDKTCYPDADAARINKWRQQFGARFFLFVGKLRYYKGLHILLDAIAIKGFPVVVVGSGPIEKELKRKATELRLNSVYFLGELPHEDKIALLQLCYALVFPSHLRSEAFGISLLEGSLYGKPMISSELGTGTTYINIHNETGLVVPPNDPAAFSAAMQFLWENPQIAGTMGESAYQRYCTLFTAKQMAESYVHLYRSLLNSQ